MGIDIAACGNITCTEPVEGFCDTDKGNGYQTLDQQCQYGEEYDADDAGDNDHGCYGAYARKNIIFVSGKYGDIMLIVADIITGIFGLAFVFVFDNIRLGMLAFAYLSYQTLNGCVFNGLTDLFCIGMMDHDTVMIYKIGIGAGKIKIGNVSDLFSYISDIKSAATESDGLAVYDDRGIH